MATWQQNINAGGFLGGIGQVNTNAPQASDANAALSMIRQNNELARTGRDNIGLQALQGLSGVAQAYQQSKMQETQAAFNQAHANAWQTGDTSALRDFAVQNPAFISQAQQAVSGLDAGQRSDMTNQAAKLRLALSQGPEAYGQYLQKNAGDLSRVGANPAVLAQMGMQNPQGAAQLFDTIGMAGSGDKYFDILDKQQGRQIDREKLAETARNNDMTNARGWGQIAVSRENSIRSAGTQLSGQGLAAQRLALDQDKFAFDQQQAKDKADLLKNGAPKLTDATSKMIDDSISTAAASQNSANTMNTLASQLEEQKPTAGLFGSMQNNIAKITGSDSYIRDLKIRRAQLASSQAVKNLPPGPASDKDIQFAREGVPDDKDGPEVWARWLRGNAKMEQINADASNFKAEWVSANGNPGQSRNGGNVLGLDVQKGESMNAAIKRYIGQQQSEGQSPNPSVNTGQNTAPAAALEALKNNPSLAKQFQAKYGYLP